ncbi:MAG: hypothetical protein ACK5NB_10735 [Flavobacteriaceae bacterium]
MPLTIATNLIFPFIISFIGIGFLYANTALFFKDNSVQKKVSKVFIVYLLALSVIETVCHGIGLFSYIFGMLRLDANFFVSHLYFIFQFVFLSYLFYGIIKNKRIKNTIVIVFFVEMVLLAFSYISNPGLFWQFNTFEIVSTSFVLITYAFTFIFLNIDKVHKYFNFCIGLILYLLCSASIFMSGNTDLVLFSNAYIYIDIWVLNSIFYIVFQYKIYQEYRFLKAGRIKQI